MTVTAALPAQAREPETMALSAPKTEGGIPVEQALRQRRSVRAFNNTSLSLEHLSQLLWAAQGITEPKLGLRTSPSSGGLYPLSLYVLTGDGGIDGLKAGFYRYVPAGHELQKIKQGDKRAAVAEFVPSKWFGKAPVVLVFAADFGRAAKKYGDRAERYCLIETGTAAQNVYLQVESLGLGATILGAFYEGKVAEILGIGKNETPLALMAVGHPDKK